MANGSLSGLTFYPRVRGECCSVYLLSVRYMHSFYPRLCGECCADCESLALSLIPFYPRLYGECCTPYPNGI